MTEQIGTQGNVIILVHVMENRLTCLSVRGQLLHTWFLFVILKFYFIFTYLFGCSGS